MHCRLGWSATAGRHGKQGAGQPACVAPAHAGMLHACLVLCSAHAHTTLPPFLPEQYWVLGGRSDEHFRARWEQATDEALAQLMVYPPGWPFSYVADSQVGRAARDAVLSLAGAASHCGLQQHNSCVLPQPSFPPTASPDDHAYQCFARQGGTLDPTLEHLRCFYPGSIALGVMSGGVSGDKAARYLEFAGNMTQVSGLGWSEGKKPGRQSAGSGQAQHGTARGAVAATHCRRLSPVCAGLLPALQRDWFRCGGGASCRWAGSATGWADCTILQRALLQG